MTGVFKAAAQLQEVCDQQEWSYCFIGGLALQRWGEPRMTKDADLTLITGFGREEGFVDTLLRHFQGRIADAREFALRNRVLLLRAESGVGLDVALGALPFEDNQLAPLVAAKDAPEILTRLERLRSNSR